MAKLEAAERDTALKERIIDSRGSTLNAAANERDALRAELADLRSSMTFRTSLIGRIEAERDALRAKIEAMEQQEPVVWRRRSDCGWSYKTKPVNGLVLEPLYLAPGAHPAPSVPEGWLRAIDEALVVAHIGVANANDTYEQAKAKLDIYRESLPCHSSKDKSFEEALNCLNFKASEQEKYAEINHSAVADAYLRAAAPDLLNELLSILDWAVTERAPLRKQEIESIRKVIAKATGEQP